MLYVTISTARGMMYCKRCCVRVRARSEPGEREECDRTSQHPQCRSLLRYTADRRACRQFFARRVVASRCLLRSARPAREKMFTQINNTLTMPITTSALRFVSRIIGRMGNMSARNRSMLIATSVYDDNITEHTCAKCTRMQAT